MLEFYGEAYRDTQDFPSPPVHDACAVAYVIDRAVLQVQRAPIDVELTGTLTRGMTVVDYWGVTERAKNAFFVRSGDPDAFYALLTERVARLP